jgi:hypothetical protein
MPEETTKREEVSRGVYGDKRKDAMFNSRQHVPGSRDNR